MKSVLLGNWVLRHKLALVLLTLPLLLVNSAFAQSSFGDIVGSVTDPTGARVPNAHVTVTNIATSEKRMATTNQSGDYELLSLPPGQYSVAVEAAGFKRFVQSPVEVLVAQATRIGVTLPIGQVTQEVEVTSAAPIIQTENATLGQVVQGRAVTEMPLNGRDVLALVQLIPGVVMQGGSTQNLTSLNIFSGGNFQISGGASNQSTTLIDGSPVNVIYGHLTTLVPSQDSVQEFKVQTSSNTVEYGMYTGGVVNISTKSGTNQIHGTADEFLRNTIFNDVPYFAKHNSANILPNAPYHQNQYGANAGFPVIKDKLFGFFDFQGYRQVQAYPLTYSVPTLAELGLNPGEIGVYDFSATGIPQIYNPFSTCGTGTNPACTAAQNAGTAAKRTPFVGNIIPSTFVNPVSQAIIKYGYWAKPTNTGLTSNFISYVPYGGNNIQYTSRVDFQASSKQRIFTRYTYWNSENLKGQPYNNGLIGGPESPEGFTVNQTVVGDTYIFNPSLIGDLRVSYLRYNYARSPAAGYDETQLGLPSYYGTLNSLDSLTNATTFPGISIGTPTENNVAQQIIQAVNNNYVIAPSVTKIKGNHTFEAGADLRRLEWQHYQNTGPGTSFTFSDVFSDANGGSTSSSSGYGVADFILGTPASGTAPITPKTFETMYYQGYYVQDAWNITRKLTVTYGVRWEIPGVGIARHGYDAVFNPTEANSAAAGISVNGNPVVGAFDLVNTPQHPVAGTFYEHFNNFSPRVGIAYRLNDKTVVRVGAGKYVVPTDANYTNAPDANAVNANTNNMITSLNSNLSPNNTLSNPYPGGFIPAPRRTAAYQQDLLGGSASMSLGRASDGSAYQWNVALQSQLPAGIALEVAYAGNHGIDLPLGSPGVNQLSPTILAQMAANTNCVPTPGPNCPYTKQVTNPFFGIALQGTLAATTGTVSANQLLRPFPQYGSIANVGDYAGLSNYNALQMKVERRFSSGGTLLGTYAFSKLSANAESLTTWLDTIAPYQNLSNLRGEYSLASADARQRAVISYVYSLPFGRGQRFGSGVSGVADKVVSGWGVNGITTFQDGYPLAITTNANNIGTYALQGTERPDLVAGCARRKTGPITARLGDSLSTNGTYLNTACFTTPGVGADPQTIYNFGNESRTDNAVRSPGIANYDFALYKDTHITERIAFQFRVESFNLFNRVQFAAPVSLAVGNSQFGQITSTANSPRQIQLGARVNF